MRKYIFLRFLKSRQPPCTYPLKVGTPLKITIFGRFCQSSAIIFKLYYDFIGLKQLNSVLLCFET